MAHLVLVLMVESDGFQKVTNQYLDNLKFVSELFVPLKLRCLFFTSLLGCKKGDACAFCHHLVTEQQAGLALVRPKNTQRRKITARIQHLVRQLNAEAQQPSYVVLQLQHQAMQNSDWISSFFLVYFLYIFPVMLIPPLREVGSSIYSFFPSLFGGIGKSNISG